MVAEEATKGAEEANRAKSLFLTTMSHELRTPLNAIGGYVDLLALEIRGPLVDAQREDLRRIKKSGQHLLSLINDILNLAKIESGQLDLHVRDVSLALVFENVDTLVAPQFNSKGIAYVFPQCDPRLYVRADGDKLQQILLNVLSNACKFTERRWTCDRGVRCEERRRQRRRPDGRDRGSRHRAAASRRTSSRRSSSHSCRSTGTSRV